MITRSRPFLTVTLAISESVVVGTVRKSAPLPTLRASIQNGSSGHPLQQPQEPAEQLHRPRRAAADVQVDRHYLFAPAGTA
jgi:hypothetical protein